MNSSGSQRDASDMVALWKHFAETGDHDKNSMVQICNWLLAISVAIVGLAFAKDVHTRFVNERWTFLILGSFGTVISLVSVSVALIYGGYANWNWAKADQVARDNNWNDLDPDHDPWTEDQKTHSWVLARWARCLSYPVNTYNRLAPIFIVYFGLSVLSAIATSAVADRGAVERDGALKRGVGITATLIGASVATESDN